jgi:quinol monooxygenase YgiN
MILVVGTVRVPESAFEIAKDAIEKMVTATRAEDGCIRYAFAQDVLDRGVMHISEAWRDRDALMAHGRTAHMAEWREAIGKVGASERDLRIYETDEGQPI